MLHRCFVLSVIVPGTLAAFAASAGAQIVTLIPPPAGAIRTAATALNQDGTVVVGSYNDYQGAFRWTNTNGLAVIPPPNGYQYAHATDVSRNGTVVAGSCGNNPNNEGDAGFRWTAQNGTIAVGPFSYGG